MLESGRQNLPKVFLGFIGASFVSLHCIWLAHDRTPLGWDPAWNMLVSQYYAKLSMGREPRNFEELLAVFPILKHAIDAYPPFFKLCSVPLYWAFGLSTDVGVATNLIFYGVMLFSVYAIAKRLGGVGSGVLAGFLVSTMPLLVGLSRVYLLEFALAAMTALSLYLLMRSENFQNRRFSLSLGVALGLGILTKIQFAFIIFPVVIMRAVVAVLQKDWNKKQSLHFAMALSLTAVLFLPWLLLHWDGALKYMRYYSSVEWANMEGDPSWMSWQGVSYYWISTSNGSSFVYFILFIISVGVLAFWAKRNNDQEIGSKIEIIGVQLGCIITTILFFTGIANKDHRYIAPILPSVAVLAAAGCFLAPVSKRVRDGFLVVLVVFGSFQIHRYTEERLRWGPNLHWGDWYLFTHYNQYLVPPREDDWKIGEILSRIQEDAEKVKISKPWIGIHADIFAFNPIVFQLEAYRSDVPVGYMSLGSEDFKQFHYIITKTGDIRIDVFKDLNERLQKGSTHELVQEFSLPDQSMASLFRLKQ